MPATILQADFFHKKNIGLDHILSLREYILSVKDKEPSVDDSNYGCWRSAYRYQNINWLMQEVCVLVNEAVEFYKRDQVFSKSLTDRPYKINYWTNVNNPGSRNVMHSHSQSHFSCVYYIQGTGTGDLRLINPANILSSSINSGIFVRDFYFSPTDGDLILWPGWIPHEVEPNLSSKQRINIVFDIIL